MRWLAARRRTTLVWSSVVGAAALTAAVFAIRSPGYAVTDVSLNDGGVWVTYNDPNTLDMPPVGRFDKPVGQLSDGLTAPGGAQSTYQLDVYQSGSNVLLFDTRKGTLHTVNAAAVVIQDPDAGVRIPSHDVIGLGADTVAVLEPPTGKVWTAPADALPSFAPGADRPTLRVGPDAGVAVAVDGTVFAASAVGHRVATLHPGDVRALITGLPASLPPDSLSVTAVGSTPVLLDARTRTVILPRRGRTVRLPESQTTLQTVVLQQPGPSASHVLVADTTTLYSVPLGGGDVVALSRIGRGVPAAPVRVAGCDYGAWSGAGGAVARACDGSPVFNSSLTSRSVTVGRLVFRVNRDQLVLNGPDTGAIWGVDSVVERLDDWNDVRPPRQTHSRNVRIRNHHPRSRSSQDRPPVVRPDQLGARSARSTILHPLDNDFDPDGDILAIDAVTQVDDPYAHVDVVSNGEALKVTVDGGTQRDVHFRYTVDDGRGKEASAEDTVHVFLPTENTPPFRLATAPSPPLKLAPGEAITVPVLPDWRDSNGDPLFIADASAGAGSASISGGSLLYTAGPPGATKLSYQVSDGIASVSKTITVHVLKPNATPVPPSPLPDVVAATAGEPVTIHPLANDQPGADPTDPSAQLTLEPNLDAPAGMTATADPATGSIVVSAQRPQTYLLDYTAAFGSTRPVTGRIRLDVAAPEAPRSPITLPDVAVLRGQASTVIDPVANDVDPQNAMLVVQSAAVEGGAPVDVAVQDHHWLVLRSTRFAIASDRGGSGNFVVRYTVSDGLTPAVYGEVVGSQLAPAAKDLPPLASPDATVVRAGSSTEISVLANDTDPEGEQLSLQPGKLQIHSTERSKASGSAWAVDGVVRYVAPPAAAVRVPRRIEVDYLVRDTAENASIGQLFVTVNPVGSIRHDSPPAPLPIEARLEAGQEVTLHVPVYGVDPDGDPVTFSGIATAPQLGRVVSTGPDSIVYQAYPQSTGSDRFAYQVADPFGKVGTAAVLISVAPATPMQAPVADDDEAAAAPGRLIRIDVLRNDLVADGDPISITLPRRSSGAYVSGNRVVARAPRASLPPARIRYVLTDGNGAKSSAIVTLRGTPGVDNPPVARDDYVARPPAGAGSITVDVRANDDDPDDARTRLRVASTAAGARVLGRGRIALKLGLRPKLVPYTISDGKESSEAYVHVPARLDDRPAIRRGVQIVQVAPGGSRRVALSEVASDARGRVRLTTLDALHATPSAAFRVTGSGTNAIVISASARYHGPGAVTFEVTDGKTLGDPNGRRALLTLPVRAGPDAPVLRCPSKPLSLVIGASPTILDLANTCLVWLDDPSRLADLHYRATTASADSVAVRRIDGAGRRVSFAALPTAKPDVVVPLRLEVSGVGRRVLGRLLVRTVAAPSPALAPISLNATVGNAVTFDAATSLTSPFGAAARPKLVGVRGGRDLSIRSSGTRVTVTPRAAGSLTFSILVTDIASRPERAVATTVIVHAQATAVVKSSSARGHQAPGTGSKASQHRPSTTTTSPSATTTTAKPPTRPPKGPPAPPPAVPDAPGTPYSTSVGSGQVVLAWTVPGSNGQPIDKYQVGDAASDAWPCLGSPCTIDSGLANGKPYQFKVQAHNAAGWSSWSALSQPITPDAVPGLVSTIGLQPSNGSIHVTWQPPPNSGSPLTGYDVQISPAPPAGAADQTPSGSDATFDGLTNGTAYSVRVRSHNNAGWSDWSAASASTTPFGAPAAMGAPTAAGVDSADAHEKAITVSWSAADGNGRPISQYTVTPRSSLPASTQTPITVDGGTLQHTFTVPNDGAKWTYTVTATNSGGLTSPPSPPSAQVAADTRPDSVASASASDNANGVGFNGAVKLSFTVPITNGLNVTSVQWRSSSGGSGTQALTPATTGTAETITVSGLTNGTAYTFSVAVCNADGCGGYSPSSNSVTPYGSPGSPTAGASANGTAITYSWSGGGGGGRPIANYQISVDGGPWQDEGPNAGSTSVGYGYSQTHSVQARVVDTAGQVSPVSNTASARTIDQPPPPPSVSISKGAPTTVSGCPTAPPCAYVIVSIAHFAPNTRYSAYLFCDGPGCNGTTQDFAPYEPEPITTDGAGNGSLRFWVYGNPGTHVWATVNGVTSGKFTW